MVIGTLIIATIACIFVGVFCHRGGYYEGYKSRYREIEKEFYEKRVGSPHNRDLQSQIGEEVQKAFGRELFKDPIERSGRVVEESVELAQSLGLSKASCHDLVDFVYAKKKGKAIDEVGDVAMTLYALAESQDISVKGQLENTLSKFKNNVDKIVEKQKTKPPLEREQNEEKQGKESD